MLPIRVLQEAVKHCDRNEIIDKAIEDLHELKNNKEEGYSSASLSCKAVELLILLENHPEEYDNVVNTAIESAGIAKEVNELSNPN